MEAEIIVKEMDRGMRIDYKPVSDFAKLLALTCGRKCLTKKQLNLWKSVAPVTILE